MKIRVADRFLVALAGLVLIALSAGVVTEAFFAVPLTGVLAAFLASRETVNMVIAASCAAVLLLLGLYCVAMLFRRRGGKRGFVLQRTENGELSISIRAIEGLVQKCVDQHDELHINGMSLQNARDGLIIRLRVALAGGVNIPLAVGALQKQIKQYVTACSGVDVREVRVQVETSASKLKQPSAYAVPDVTPGMPAYEEPIPAAQPAMQQEPDKKQEGKRPLHQRLFGREEQPATVPVPPEMAEKAEETAAPEEIAEQIAPEDEPAEAPEQPQEAAVPAENEEAETLNDGETQPMEETADDEAEEAEAHELAD